MTKYFPLGTPTTASFSLTTRTVVSASTVSPTANALTASYGMGPVGATGVKGPSGVSGPTGITGTK